MSHRYNRRQRKKLHLAEFQEMGFSIDGVLKPAIDKAQRDLPCDAFIEECIEANGLGAGGGFNDDFSFYVVSNELHGSTTETHRALVGAWLENRSEIASVTVLPLSDAWHGRE
ncbi:MAG: YggL family protein [Janthinobacterium lividum]